MVKTVSVVIFFAFIVPLFSILSNRLIIKLQKKRNTDYMNTLRKILSFIFGFIFLFLFAFAVWAFLVTFPLRLDETKLKNVENNITVFDEQNDCCFVCSTEGKNGVNYEELKKETIAAFICAEDRSFFEHKGLN